MNTQFADVLRPFVPRHHGPIEDDLKLRDAGLDSLHAIDLLLAVEDQFAVEFPADLLNDQTFDTAGSLLDAVHRLRDA